MLSLRPKLRPLIFPLLYLLCAGHLSVLRGGELTIERLEEGIINHRPTSTRCEVLNQERREMVERRHRYVALISRGDRLLNLLDQREDPQTQRRIEDIRRRLGNEIHLLDERLHNREENIVRTGCPTIRF